MTKSQLPPQPEQESDARTALTTRKIPTMTLSTASNPLTAPFPLPSTTSAPSASTRFSTRGTALLTGGAGSLALACASGLLENGTSALTLLDLASTLHSSHAQISALQASFPKIPITIVACDVTSETDVTFAFETAAKSMGSIDMVCCFAGIVGCVPSIDADVGAFRKVLDVNLTGSFICAQAAARCMIAQNSQKLSSSTSAPDAGNPTPIPGYSIILTASMSASGTNYPQPQAAYNASKAAIVSLTKSLAAEWAVHGIRVNCISPGYLDTILNAGNSLNLIRDVWASRCPMGRMGDVEEVVGLVVLLSSIRAGRYITGSDFLVDGGARCF